MMRKQDPPKKKRIAHNHTSLLEINSRKKKCIVAIAAVYTQPDDIIAYFFKLLTALLYRGIVIFTGDDIFITRETIVRNKNGIAIASARAIYQILLLFTGKTAP